jgi:hypothetical protein
VDVSMVVEVLTMELFRMSMLVHASEYLGQSKAGDSVLQQKRPVSVGKPFSDVLA